MLFHRLLPSKGGGGVMGWGGPASKLANIQRAPPVARNYHLSYFTAINANQSTSHTTSTCQSMSSQETPFKFVLRCTTVSKFR